MRTVPAALLLAVICANCLAEGKAAPGDSVRNQTERDRTLLMPQRGLGGDKSGKLNPTKNDLLEFDTKAAEHLPSFDNGSKRSITVEHLLTHTSGLPMSLLIGKELSALEGIQAVADLGGTYDLDSYPGSAISYSDQGTEPSPLLVNVLLTLFLSTSFSSNSAFFMLVWSTTSLNIFM